MINETSGQLTYFGQLLVKFDRFWSIFTYFSELLASICWFTSIIDRFWSILVDFWFMCADFGHIYTYFHEETI